VSLTNPKTLLFYAAFFPQFLDPSASTAWQSALLAATFLAVAVAIDSSWVVGSARAARMFRWLAHERHRISGGLFLASGIALAFSRRGT